MHKWIDNLWNIRPSYSKCLYGDVAVSVIHKKNAVCRFQINIIM